MSDDAQPRGSDVRAGWEPMLLAPAAPAIVHLDDDGLLRVLTRTEHKHIAECGWCRERQRIVQLGTEGSDGTDEEFEQVLDGDSWEDAFHRAAADAILPSTVRRLMTVRSIPDDVAPGQLWRMTWKNRHLLAAVIAVDGWHVLVAPVTTDSELADEYTLLVPADQSPIEAEIAVRVRQRTAVPLFVLDRYLGVLPPSGDHRMAVADVLDALVRAHRTGSSDTSGVTVGHPLSPEDADAVAFADALAEEAVWFASATRGLHYLSDESQNRQSSASPVGLGLAELIAGSGLTLSQLAERTGLAAGRLVELRRGAPGSEAEVSAVAAATGSPVEVSLTAVGASAFHTIMAEVSAPRRRAARAAWTRENVPDGDPDDPTELVEWLLRKRVAARTVPGQPIVDDADSVRAYWRDRVAVVLADFS